MEWIRQGITRIKEALGFGKNISTEDCVSKKEAVTVDLSSSGIVPIFGLRMRPRKDFKTRKDVAKSVEDILKIRKPNQRTFKSPIVRPVRVKKGSTWMQRLLSSSSNSASSSDQDILDYFRVSASNDVEEPVWKTYTTRFLKREHFNFVGSDKNLGPLVISIKYPNAAIIKSNNFKENLDKKLSEKTSLILRLPSGIMKRSWNQFQLSNPTVKSPLELVKLSFPNLVLSCGLLPVFYPDISEIIAKYDETCNTDGISNKSYDVVTQNIEKVETSSNSMKLKILQRKLITNTCKFIELSGWNLNAYEDFFAEKKASSPKYTSFSLPLTLRTPKMCSKLVKKVKSPKFMTLPKKMLIFDYEVPSPPAALSLEDHLDGDDCALEVISIENDVVDDVGVLGDQMINLRVEIKNDPDESDDEPDLEIRFKNLELEKKQILKSNSLLKKEKVELCRSERRLVRELATAHTIIDNLKKRHTTT